jgi:hemerythrin-like domain-containing protein
MGWRGVAGALEGVEMRERMIGRRRFLAGAGMALVATGVRAAEAGGEEIAPGEDLMREHGVLRRVMLVYDEAVRRMGGRHEVPLDVVSAGAGIIRRVIEDYHEKLEEEFLFPRFESAGTLTELVAVLRGQHKAGRAVTADVLRLTKGSLRSDADRERLAARLTAFTRMYRPHASREDTVLFPAFRSLVGPKAYAGLGEEFEEREKKLLGESGFEGAVHEVAKLETALGIHDLAKFTPA